MHKRGRVKMEKGEWVIGTWGGEKEGKEGGEDPPGKTLWTSGLQSGVLRPKGCAGRSVGAQEENLRAHAAHGL